MQPTKFCTFFFFFWRPPGQSETDSLFTGHHFTQLSNFILAIHRGNPRQSPCSLVTFSRRFTLFPFQKIKNIALLEMQIYLHQERIHVQTKRVTSSSTYFFLRFCFDDKPFHLKIFTREKIYLSSLHFIHKSC